MNRSSGNLLSLLRPPRPLLRSRSARRTQTTTRRYQNRPSRNSSSAASLDKNVIIEEEFFKAKLPPMDHKSRRQNIFSQFPSSSSLFLVLGGDEQTRNGFEGNVRFRQSSDFLYLTGIIREPGCFLLANTTKTVLLMPRKTETDKIWTGSWKSLEDVMGEEERFDKCLYVNEINEAMEYLFPNSEAAPTTMMTKTCYVAPIQEQQQEQQHEECERNLRAKLQKIDAFRQSKILGPIVTNDKGDAGKDSSFWFDFKTLPDKIAKLRAIKTEEEIARIKRANDGSSDAHVAMWKSARANKTHEFQLEAEFVAASTKRNLRELGYPCIVGSGRNAAILHYEKNDALCKEKEIVLVDAGAECEGYTADITRCFPSDGKFTKDAKTLYSVVLDVQKDAIANYQKGAFWQDIAKKAKLKTIEGLQKKLGVVREDVNLNEALVAGISEVFLPHALGHFLGLAVHDPGRPNILQVGNVITCEPGVYFIEALYEQALSNERQKKFLDRKNIERFAKIGGVRIEDNIWITEDGPINLTRCPKEVLDIENIMNQAT